MLRDFRLSLEVSQDISNERTAFIPKVLCTKRNLECKTTTLLDFIYMGPYIVNGI